VAARGGEQGQQGERPPEQVRDAPDGDLHDRACGKQRRSGVTERAEAGGDQAVESPGRDGCADDVGPGDTERGADRREQQRVIERPVSGVPVRVPQYEPDAAEDVDAIGRGGEIAARRVREQGDRGKQSREQRGQETAANAGDQRRAMEGARCRADATNASGEVLGRPRGRYGVRLDAPWRQ
jgi:hypothetical protein